MRKRETEVNMYDPLLAKAEDIGVQLPLTRRWIAMIREIESGAREQTTSNLDELKATFS